jgi:energy-coupling factor transporter ATP-binding protein EcfA2
MILDEPTGSLDPRTRESFFELFEALAATATLVLCSHRLDEVRPLVDRVLLLDDGRLAYDGPASTFLARAARATIEAWVDGDAAATWLAARGFRRSPAGMWFRTLDCAGKTTLLFELIRELGPALRNVSARDHEGLALVPGAARG